MYHQEEYHDTVVNMVNSRIVFSSRQTLLGGLWSRDESTREGWESVTTLLHFATSLYATGAIAGTCYITELLFSLALLGEEILSDISKYIRLRLPCMEGWIGYTCAMK